MKKSGKHVEASVAPPRRLPLQWTGHCWLLFIAIYVLSGCAPSPQANVLGYLVAQRSGRLTTTPQGPSGTLTGQVRTVDGRAVAGATVLVAERTSRVHSAQSDATGQYTITQIPPGRYVPAALAPGFEERTLQTKLGNPHLVEILSNQTTTAPPFMLHPQQPTPLPADLATAVALQLTATAVVTAPFPAGATATVHAYQFRRANASVDTLRLYLPNRATEPTAQSTSRPVSADATQLPLLFMLYPTAVDAWQSVSVAYAAQGYALLALSPVAARALDIKEHAADARVALALAQQGLLNDAVRAGPVVALGGSFSSAILYRLLRDDTQQGVAGWVTVGGIADAFAGTAAFYAGEIEIPSPYEYLIPALGPPNLYPLAFLRYSPVYSAAELPETLIIHTAADTIIPIEQAHALEAALVAAGVPIQVFYYQDVSHYLQIDEQMTDAGRTMFYRVLAFAERILKP